MAEPPPGAIRFVRMAVALASANVERRQRPYGALVVADEEVLGEGVNTVLRDNDPTAHAEVAAIRAACARRGDRNLAGAFLVSSCHPCGMCQQVIRLVGIDSVLYAGRCRTQGVDLPDLAIRLVTVPAADRPFEEFARLGLPELDRPPRIERSRQATPLQ